MRTAPEREVLRERRSQEGERGSWRERVRVRRAPQREERSIERGLE